VFGLPPFQPPPLVVFSVPSDHNSFNCHTTNSLSSDQLTDW